MRLSDNLAKRKAISGIIAGLILFVMLFTVGTGYFLWVSTNNGLYSQAQAGRDQAVQNQQGESILLTASLNSGMLYFTALNEGGQAVNLTAYFVNSGNQVVCQNIIKVGFTTCPTSGVPPRIPVGAVLNPGASPYTQSTGYNCASCTISNPATIEVLTARGNVFTVAYPLPNSAACAGGSFAPSITTTLSTNTGTVQAGTPVSDTASLTNGCNPTGNITFTVYPSSANPPCSGAALYTSNAIVVSGNGPYTSIPFYVPESIGTYYWEASYSGDTNNLAISTTCGIGGEVLTVTMATPTITTTLTSSSIPAGQSVSDSASLVNPSGNNAGGTVAYFYTTSATCPSVGLEDSGTATGGSSNTITDAVKSWAANVWVGASIAIVEGKGAGQLATIVSNTATVISITGAWATVPDSTSIFFIVPSSPGLTLAGGTTVAGGVIPSSPLVAFNQQGVFNWFAAYSGDPNNEPASSPCEPLSVTKPTGQTQLPLAIQLNSFRFLYPTSTTYYPGDGDAPNVGGYYGYVVPLMGNSLTVGTPPYIFAVTLENVDPQGRSITFNSLSFLFVTVLSGGSGQCYSYPLYIMGTPTDGPPYTGVTPQPFTSDPPLQFGAATTLYFGADTPDKNTLVPNAIQCGSNSFKGSALEAAVAPFVVGEYSDGTPLSLTLPFTSVFATTANALNNQNPPNQGCSPVVAGECQAQAGTTVTLRFNTGFASGTPPSVYGVFAPSGTPTQESATCTYTASWTCVFPLQAGITPGHYMLFATDGSNYAYATLNVVGTSGTSASCAITTLGVGTPSTCTATATGNAPTGTVTWTTSGTGSVTFPNGATCTLVSGSCSVTVKGSGVGSVILTATYNGDGNNGQSSGNTALAVSHTAVVMQSVVLCSGPAVASPCTGKLPNPVTAGDLLVIAIGTEKATSACTTVSAVADGGDPFTTASSVTASAASSCVYTTVRYATFGASGSPTISVTLSSADTSAVIMAYEISGVTTGTTVRSGSCTAPCTTAMSTSATLTPTANSFLVTVADLYQNTISSASQPAGFTTDYRGTASGNADYVSHEIPASVASTNFAMTASAAPASWAELVVQFAVA
jgi:hypothetical protein